MAEHKSGRAVLNWLWLALATQHLGKAEEEVMAGEGPGVARTSTVTGSGLGRKQVRVALPQLAGSARPAPRGGSTDSSTGPCVVGKAEILLRRRNPPHSRESSSTGSPPE